MSLRARLTLLYTSMLGGILLIFGVVVYVLVTYLMVTQVDVLLWETANKIISKTTVSQVGGLKMIELPDLEMTANVFIQVWDRQGKLAIKWPSLSQMDTPLDSLGLKASQWVYRDVYIDTNTADHVHFRVLSVPIEVGGLPIGVLQTATSLNVVDSTRRNLLLILIVVTIFAVIIAALGSWLGVGQALAPLKTVTDTAQQITRADDLSRRIPYDGPAADEIGTLIRAFNRTLGRLENLFTAQQRFLADVSHELRTPLTVIKGNVDLIRRFGADDESLDSIKDESDRLTRLVGDLLLLAQAESGKLPLNRQPVELDTLLLDVFQQMRVLAGEKVNLKLTEIDQVLVYGDRDRLKQVFINLVSNAIHYTPQGGDVFLSMNKTGSQVRVIVQDTGPGIAAKDLPRIFDRFYRTEKSRTRSKDSGYGLGLSIVHAIVDRHDGNIEVDSTEGKGTTFCVRLPLYIAEESKN